MKDQINKHTDMASVDRNLDSKPSRSSIPLRLGLIASGLLVFETGASIWLQSESAWRFSTLAICTAAWLLGMTCYLAATVARVSSHVQWLILACLIGELWGSAYVDRMNYSPSTVSHTDNEMIGEYSAQALGHGYNPYMWNFSDATRAYRDQGLRITTFLDGSPQNRVTYPALPTLLVFAFGRIGLGQARLIGLIFHTILLILIFVNTPVQLRVFLALPLFAIRDFVVNTLTGLQDVVWSTMLVGMVLAWNRPTLRAVLFGLACAYRQQAWLVAPFLLIYMWNELTPANSLIGSGPGPTLQMSHQGVRSVLRDQRLRAIGYFAAIGFGVFLLINLPFMLWDFRSWTLGVFEPTYAAFNVYSQGLGALSQYNLVQLPRQFYAGLQLSSLAIMLIIHWRHPRRVGQAFWVFPGIFFWLYYRGLTNYWLYWIPPFLVAIAHYRWHVSARTETDQRWRWTAAFAAAIVAANLVWGILLLRQPPAIRADLLYPISSSNKGYVSQLNLIVANSTDRVLRPRFSVQHDSLQPLPWDIESGPEQLLPGQSATYVIGKYSAWRDFAAGRGAQVVITDASNDYSLRAVIDVPGDPTFDSPDRIINPAFIFWSPPQNSPAGWAWYSSDRADGRPRLDQVDGRRALVFPVQDGTGLLSQTVTFPGPFAIWVRPVALRSDESRESYGLQFDDAQHRLRVLFGDREGSEQVNEDVAVWYVRAPLDQWSRQEVDLGGLYAHFGWELPAYSVRSQQGLEFAARQVTLRLIVSGLHASHVFGPIEQDPGFASPRSLVEEAIAHPDDYYVNMGDEYCRQRNVDLAREAYRHALAYNPGNPLAQLGVESCP